MRLTVVGCSGSFPGPDSAASCYLVEVGDGGRVHRVLLDLGNGSLGVLQRFADIYAVDAVLLSHLHADHCLDLCAYYVARRYRPGGPAPRLPVYGPAGTAARMARAYDLPERPGMTDEFDFRDLSETAFDIGPLRVRAARVVHPVEAYAFRLEAAGRSLVYSGDTGPSEALVGLAGGADVLVCEAAFDDADDNPPGLHLTGREAGEHASRAGVARLLVTHVPPWGDAASTMRAAADAYAGRLDLAVPGLVVDLSG